MTLAQSMTKASAYAVKCHTETNHTYDGKDYAYHLASVFSIGFEYITLIPKEDRYNILAACWTHDLIEDARQTYNDVKAATNEMVAEITYALTNEKGKTRSERANDKYYEGIRSTKYASFVKLCDRIANVEYSKQKGSSMLEKYKAENAEFIKKVRNEGEYQELVDQLNRLFE